MPSLIQLAITLYTLLMLAHPVYADSWRDQLPQAKEIGSGDLRWYGFKIYSAKLWSEQLPFDADAAFALQLTYHRHITTDQFVSVSINEIKRLTGNKYSEETLKNWAAQLTKIFPDVDAGDQLIGVYLPHRGCVFYDDKKLLAEINDPELAKAFFSIWLDERTKDPYLRAQLLGTKR